MPSKKKSQVETLPPEMEAKQTRRQVVEAKHTVTYLAPEIVEIPIEQDEEETPEGEAVEAEQVQRPPSFRTKIRERFKARGIGVDETLMLRIDRLPFFEQNGLAGVRSDKEFCGVLPCKENFFDGDEYLIEIQRRYGPGDYQLTVRHKNFIVSSWREHIGGFSAPVAVASSEPGQPPTMIYAQPMGQAPPSPQRTIKEELRDMAEMIKLVDNIRGPREENQTNPARTEDEVLATAILKQPDVIENVVGSVIKRFGRSGGGDDDPSPWAVAMKLVESGQASQIVKAFLDSFWNGINSFRGQMNGTQTMVQTPQAPHARFENPALQNGQANQPGQVLSTQGQPQGVQNPFEASANAPGTSGAVDEHTQQPMSPEAEALALVLDHCRRQTLPKVTLAELTQREQTLQALINHHAMQTGQILTNQITLYLDLFNDMATDEVMEIVKSLPGGAEIVALPHAREWTEQLQKLIQESNGGDEE